MSDQVEKRAYEIVEELRADIDFELDDVIAQIVRGLPEDYFVMLSRDDQLRQLKALLAMGVCNLDEEIMLRSDDGSQIAVVARQNHPGLLANLLKRIPSDSELIGAKIFTSKEHDFIIDVFEFKPSNDSTPVDEGIVETTIEFVANAVGKPVELVRQFVAHYYPGNRILGSPEDVAEQFLVFLDFEESQKPAVRWTAIDDSDCSRVTVSSGRRAARNLFRKTAEYLAKQQMDIERAYLHEIPIESGPSMAIASFLVAGPQSGDRADENSERPGADNAKADVESVQAMADELAEFLKQRPS